MKADDLLVTLTVGQLRALIGEEVRASIAAANSRASARPADGKEYFNTAEAATFLGVSVAALKARERREAYDAIFALLGEAP